MRFKLPPTTVFIGPPKPLLNLSKNCPGVPLRAVQGPMVGRCFIREYVFGEDVIEALGADRKIKSGFV
jgi:hypothetical protein